MIADIIRILNYVEDNDNELIKMAKGKYKYPKTFREVWAWFKTEMKWLKRS